MLCDDIINYVGQYTNYHTKQSLQTACGYYVRFSQLYILAKDREFNILSWLIKIGIKYTGPTMYLVIEPTLYLHIAKKYYINDMIESLRLDKVQVLDAILNKHRYYWNVIYSAYNCGINCLWYLINNGYPINYQQAIVFAASGGDIELVKYFKRYTNRPVIKYAIINYHYDLVKYLCSAGETLTHFTDIGEFTPDYIILLITYGLKINNNCIIDAIVKNNIILVKWFIEYGYMTSDGSLIDYAVSGEMVRLLYSYGMQPRNGGTNIDIELYIKQLEDKKYDYDPPEDL